ncbi:3,4-dihydroxy-2-butanone-4-phosphate synthase, partial [Candidatus Acetothermia bacterium]
MFTPIEEAIRKFASGEIIILVDDENRENEGDLVIAAEHVSPEAINFMATYGRGLICAPITKERARSLNLAPMCPENTALHGTHFTVSVDAKRGITTGISAHDRATTIRLLIDKATMPDDLARPGHVFPLIAQKGGVLKRAGHTEATVDLARLAGLKPAGVLCEILNEDGTMARLPQLEEFAGKHGLALVKIADLIAYRKRNERLVERVAEANLPSVYGTFKIISYSSPVEDEEHVALVKGKVAGEKDVLVRVHSECLTG